MGLPTRHLVLVEAVFCSFALMIFSFFIHYNFPVKLLSLAALFSVAVIISKNLRSSADLRKVTGEWPVRRKLIVIFLTGFSGGILLAVLYRWHLDAPLVPESLKWFAAVAALIGCMEELVFRGYLQDSVKKYGALFSISFSTLSHTAYKCCLFLSPADQIRIDLAFLALWTIIAGSIFGLIRHISGSIIPALVAHALFDIWVYAEFVKAPWWVW